MPRIIEIKRDWLDAYGIYHAVRDGNLVELADDDPQPIPRDAQEVYKGPHNLPSISPQVKPGFQAKAEHEQVLDLIPGAGLRHQVVLGEPAKLGPRTEEEEKAMTEASEALEAKREETAVKEVEEDKANIAAGLELATEVAEKFEEARDPAKAILEDRPNLFGGKGDHDDDGKVGGAKKPATTAKK